MAHSSIRLGREIFILKRGVRFPYALQECQPKKTFLLYNIRKTMKKIFMIMSLFLATVASYGEEVLNQNSQEDVYIMKEQTVEMYNFSNFNLLDYNEYLNLTDEQKVMISSIMDDFNKKMNNVFNSKNRKKKVMKLLNKNVQKMYNKLDDEQYRIYLRIFNMELNRRGIDIL